MTVNEMSASVAVFFEVCTELQHRKNRDYHPDNVAMLEILQTAFETNITVEQDLWARVRKQMAALRRYVIDGHVESEPVESRMIDVAVYMGILSFWVAHKETIVRDAFKYVRVSRNCERPYGGPTDIGHTCLSEPLPKANRCERCLFLGWLGDYAFETQRP